MLGSTHVVEQLLFFYVSFNSYFCFSLILEVVLMFWGTDELFLGLGKGLKTLLGSTHLVKQLPFSMIP